MTVYDLSDKELEELKETYYLQLLETEGEGTSYEDLINAQNIPDEVIYNHYDGINFTEDDFFCNL